jgi:flagellum-specific peptidoglycan hydrolase FlgJ
MASGPAGVIAIARELGVTLERGPADPNRIREDATQGLPVIISTAQGRTPGHYWQITDYDAASGKFLMGDAVGRGAPGSLMSIDDIRNHRAWGGEPTALYAAGESRTIDRAPSARAGGAPEGSYRLASTQDQGSATTVDTSSNEAFARTALPIFRRIQNETGIPAEAMVAIAINEGATAPGTIAHDNGVPFGIKSFNVRDGRDVTTGLPVIHVNAWEVVNGRNVRQPSDFIQFPDADSAAQGFVDFLRRNDRYRPALEAAARGASPSEFIGLLHRAGYATDPAWQTKLAPITQMADRVGQGIQAATGAARGAVQQALQIPGNILSGARDLITNVLNATTTPAYAAEETPAAPAPGQESGTPGYSLLTPEQVPPFNRWDEVARARIAADAQATVAAQPEASIEDATRMAAQRYFTSQLLGPRQVVQEQNRAQGAQGGYGGGRTTPGSSPTPPLSQLTPEQRQRYDAQKQFWAGITQGAGGAAVNDEALIRDAVGLPPLGTGRPGDPETYQVGDRQIITGVYGQDGKPQRPPASVTSAWVQQAKREQGMTERSPITIHAGGYTLTQPEGNTASNNWIVGTRDGSIGRLDVSTGETQALFQGTPQQQVTIRNNPSGTGTQVWVHDDQGHATLASNNVDAFAEQLKRFEPHVTTANGTTTVTWVDRATGDTTVSRDRDPLGQAPQVRTVGGQLAITNAQPNAEGTGYNTSTQFQTPPLTIRDILGTKVSNATGTYVMMPTTNEDGTPGLPRQVLVPGTRGGCTLTAPAGRSTTQTGGVPTQVGEMPTRRQWFQVRDPFGGIGMMDRATGDFFPVRQAAPKIVDAGDRYIMITPPRLTPMKGRGDRVQDLGQIPWQVRNLTPRAMAIYQGMLSGGSGRRRRTYPPAAPPRPNPPRQPERPRRLGQPNRVDSRIHRYRWSRWVGPRRTRKTRMAPTRKGVWASTGFRARPSPSLASPTRCVSRSPSTTTPARTSRTLGTPARSGTTKRIRGTARSGTTTAGRTATRRIR